MRVEFVSGESRRERRSLSPVTSNKDALAAEVREELGRHQVGVMLKMPNLSILCTIVVLAPR